LQTLLPMSDRLIQPRNRVVGKQFWQHSLHGVYSHVKHLSPRTTFVPLSVAVVRSLYESCIKVQLYNEPLVISSQLMQVCNDVVDAVVIRLE
jgi:hypothetical protein